MYASFKRGHLRDAWLLSFGCSTPSIGAVCVYFERTPAKRSGSVWDNGRLATTREKIHNSRKKRKKNVFFFWFLVIRKRIKKHGYIIGRFSSSFIVRFIFFGYCCVRCVLYCPSRVSSENSTCNFSFLVSLLPA